MEELLLDIRIEPLPEGGFLATSAALPGLVAQGRTASETVETARGVARRLLESYREHGDPIPDSLLPLSAGGLRILVPCSVEVGERTARDWCSSSKQLDLRYVGD